MFILAYDGRMMLCLPTRFVLEIVTVELPRLE
jgi:hypothetical protein